MAEKEGNILQTGDIRTSESLRDGERDEFLPLENLRYDLSFEFFRTKVENWGKTDNHSTLCAISHERRLISLGVVA